MSFSVSGTFAVLVLGLMLTIGMVYSTAADGYLEIADAHEENVRELRDQGNTAVTMTEFLLDEGSTVGTVLIDVWNNGSTALLVDRTELLVDGTYVTDEASMQVCLTEDAASCDGSRTVWQPGERLHIEVSSSDYLLDNPERAKVVVQYGGSDTLPLQGVL